MLQVARRFAIVGVALMAAAATRAEKIPLRWVFDDAVEQEFIPLFEPDVVGPYELRKAMEAYRRGDYRTTLSFMAKAQQLRLPDGRLDFVLFVTAESYRALGLRRKAFENYLYICRHFPESDKAAPSFFRAIEFAYENRDIETADSLFTVARRRWQGHALYPSMLYTMGKANYREGRYAEAAALLESIPQGSRRYAQAQFLAALCHCELHEFEKALFQLEYVRNRAGDRELMWEAAIVIADIYAVQKNDSAALRFYHLVPRTSPRYEYAQLKKSQCFLRMGKAREACDLARRAIARNPHSDYYFEFSSVLEQAYATLGDHINKARVSGRVLEQLVKFRLAFEINDEIDRVASLERQWNALAERLPELRSEVERELAQVHGLQKRLREQLTILGHEERRGGETVERGTAERRYLLMMRDSATVFADSLRRVEKELEKLQRFAVADTADSSARQLVQVVQARLDTLRTRRIAYEQEYALIMAECFGDRLEREKRIEQDRQAQFVDWTFRKYQEKKQELVALNARLTAEEKRAQDSTVQTEKAALERAFAAATRDRLTAELAADRRRLAGLITSLVDMNPGGTYNPQFLMRLAELYYDQASDEFEVQLREFERRMAEGVPRNQLTFPSIDLSKAIECYARIARDYPRSEYADMAMFYQALALQKEEKDSAANEVLLTLIRKYPQSAYYVEANMNIGRYYFDHPTVDSGRGYKRAEEAFRRVLYYRDHPQFVQALYHLGWCYYMQDQYDEAIAVYRYLVEEVELDFGKARLEDNQIANPLLREEAIDYIAVSFDERRSLDEAIRFLRLVGSFDYSSVVLKRMGELREEVRDYEQALKIYRFLEAEYPISIAAPDAALNVIRVFEAMKQPDSALVERRRFFERFGRDSEWQKTYLASDTATVRRIDSIAVMAGLYVADALYRQASTSGDRTVYASAAQTYRDVAKRYPQHSRAADARWNLALILETQLSELEAAYDHYLAYSRLTVADSSRREQAALNAVAIAQRLLPSDTGGAAAMDLAAARVVEAVDNYVRLFPRGSSRGSVMLVQGTLFFNRGMYANAAKVFSDIIGLGVKNADYYEAMFLLGQCRFKEENWDNAAELFTTVYRQGPEAGRRQEAYRLLLQSRFLSAQKLLAAQKFAEAAQAFLAIEQEYPGSEYSDVVLFNAAEALEKRDAWQDAVKIYLELARKYPSSKYAAGALFNAATDCEKVNNFKQAAEIYEMLVASYPNTDKAKDALFNLGLTYEKLGRTDKMAEVQDRYSRLYPGEKDVEVMLMRSSDYYLKAGLYEKALAGFRAYTARFPRTDRCVEAVYKMGKAYEAMNDETNARLQYLAAQKTDHDLVAAGMAGNSYYAAEAAYALARMQEKKFAAVKLTLPTKVLRQQQQKKAELLTEVAAAYQRVIEYQSERMFEAAYRIGALYDQLASSWLEQEREKLDPVKQAVFEKDLYTVAASLIQKSFIPYRKAIELAAGFDSLGMEQRHWVQESRKALLENYTRAGQFLQDAVTVMLKAPVPKNIEAKPVHNFQYQKQLHETLEPMKVKARDYYRTAYRELKDLGFSRDEIEHLREAFARINFVIGNDYAELAQRILAAPADLPKNLDEVEREDIIFQLEDIAAEVQDRAIVALEDAKGVAETEQMVDAVWYPRILQTLARLDPTKYGKNIFASVVFVTDREWALRADSVPRWNSDGASREGWYEPKTVRLPQSVDFSAGKPRMVVRADSVGAPYYLRRHAFIPGVPRSGSAYVLSSGAYEFYVNGTLLLSDTIGQRAENQIDSASGFTGLLRGGDNVLACRVRPGPQSPAAVAIVVSVLVDTSKRFQPSLPPLVVQRMRTLSDDRIADSSAVSGEMAQSAQISDTTGAKPALQRGDSSHADVGRSLSEERRVPTSPSAAIRDRRSLRAALEAAQRRLHKAQEEIKHEELEIQKLRLLLNAFTASPEHGRSLHRENAIPSPAPPPSASSPDTLK